MEKAEVKKKGNRIALAFLAFGVISGITYLFSNAIWKNIELSEPVTLTQKFPIANIELVADTVALHFCLGEGNVIKIPATIKTPRKYFLKTCSKSQKIYANYNVLIRNGDVNQRIGIFYFWRHSGGWMESYIEPFVSPPPTKNIIWKLKKVSLNEAKDGVKLSYTPERSELSTPGIIRIISLIMSIGFFIISGLIWLLSSVKFNL